MLANEEVQARIRTRPPAWLVTGVAGFIGSHLIGVPEGQGDLNGVHHA